MLFAGHSLNLVAQSAAECCHAAVDFFGVLEEIYVFFTASTHRYEILTKKAVSVPKRINTTRWSCRADATKALSEGYSQFIEALDQIADDRDELADVRCKARGLSERQVSTPCSGMTCYSDSMPLVRYFRIPSWTLIQQLQR